MGYRQNKYGSPFDRKARLTGLLLTAAFHVLLLVLSFRTGFHYLYPPPAETGILLEFMEEEPKPIQVRTGSQPKARDARPENEVRLVQQSQSSLVAEAENRGTEASPGEEGDVAVPEPQPKKKIDRRALFTTARNTQDSLAPQVAEKISESLRAGQTGGNTAVGNPEGTPQAKLAGRSVMGSLPAPDYVSEVSGQVVVTIRVDQYGAVINAIPGAKGTTLQDAATWEAARKAALKAKFNISSQAPTVQEGTITYIFRLK